MLCMRAVSKAMATQEERVHEGRRGLKRSLGRGSIINVASTSGLVAGPGMLAYTGSKHAVLGMTKVAGKFPCFQYLDFRLYQNFKLREELTISFFSPRQWR